MFQLDNAELAYGMFELYYNKYEHTKKLLNKKNKKIRELKNAIAYLEEKLQEARNDKEIVDVAED